jgi:hypothetical protein
VDQNDTLDKAHVLSQLERGLRQCNTFARYYEGKGNDTAKEHFWGGMRALGLLAYWIDLEEVLDKELIDTYDEELIKRHEKEQGIK